MPADLRIMQLLTDPKEPMVNDPFFIRADLANTGDEGTGPFVVRFELDQEASQDFPIDNVAPGDSTSVSWGIDDGLRLGDHHVYCLADAEHVVTESSSENNDRSLYFKVVEIEFGPADARHGEADYDDDALSKAVIGEIKVRVSHWLPLAFRAVDEWQHEATPLVAQYSDADANVEPASVFAAFGEAVIKHLPGMSTALGYAHDAADLIDMARSYMGTKHMGMTGARARLEAAIDDIHEGTSKAIQRATDGYERRIEAWLSPDNPDSPLVTIEYASTDASYVGQLADDLGFPAPTRENTTEPIKASMMEAFQGVMEDVNRQLFSEIS